MRSKAEVNETSASVILGVPAGKLVAYKENKSYAIWVFEGGNVKAMGKRIFGWTVEYASYPRIYRGADKQAAGGYYFALDNRLPLEDEADLDAERLALARDIVADQKARF